MFKKTIVFIFITGFLLTSCAAAPQVDNGSSPKEYEMITTDELQTLMDNDEKFAFINVHIPVAGNIPGTDAEIPFDKIEEYLDLLPQDKDEKIIIYCRSGSMGNTASHTLAQLGYTNVFNLEGGYVTWRASGLPFEELKK